MGESLAQFNQRMGRFYSDLEQDRLKALYGELGEAAQKIAAREAGQDVGSDLKFSGWAPELETKLRFTRDAVIMHPTKTSAGPWTVAEQGRNQSTSLMVTPNFGQARGTSRISAKTGKVIRGRARKARRWNGRTDGKGTASRVVAEIERTTPPKVNRFVVSVTRKHFD